MTNGPGSRRRFTFLECLTLFLLIAGALGQAIFLLGPSVSLRREIDPELLIPTPTPVPVPTPIPGAEPTPAPTPTPVPVIEAPEAPTTPSAPEATPMPSGPRPESLLREARDRLDAERTIEAERLLRQALEADPGFLPAKVELARLLASQSNFAESIRLWEEVRRDAPAGSPEALDARLEIPSLRRRRDLLEQRDSVPTPRDPARIPTPTPRPAMPAFPQPDPATVREQPSPVAVENIRMERYAESPRYDEFRMLTFDLVHQPDTPAVAPGELKVRVSFFEQIGSRVGPAEIPLPRVVLSVEEGLAGRERIRDLSAAYEVPTGGAVEGRRYYGAVIEVFVDGKEVHRAADPAFLLQFVR